MSRLRYIDGIRDGIREEMLLDERVYVMGEDVVPGGPFGATKGLAEEFGEGRVLDTPISEESVMGTAIGSAAVGYRPVLEVMFADFLTLVMNQLVNHAAKLHYMSGGQLKIPLTIRAQQGASGSFGAHHSQSLEAWFAHVPGLKVVAPSDPADAKALMRAAIREDGPVLYLEHRGLYWSKQEVDDDAGPAVIGEAAIRRPGTDVTVIALSKAVGTALDAAKQLEGEGVSVEVLDLRTISPLDTDAIIASVRRTRRAVILHEAVVSGGIGGEIAARIQEHAFADLAAPVARVGGPFAPVPSSPPLEKFFVPDVAAVVGAVQAVMAGSASPTPASRAI
ncbi:alpha-ketoacid dehydrogenase subunit beta [Conexibacter woesei]|uniref:Transketolase central region n=1 Tax=Conexibacter woesei (strain DSM 14684 / CCUG 47730 / CIP 108061 / JCM 11494 / NBRC 100937 / ID131577) TaxID=469383 RepID=D3F4P0_CONWI|nr:alpha-ketoacid dehydrogenase subunit beta [Conexibacter woesei]ADB52497.1 Transketolase central region [Conexibacter woesei DSM 14684]